MANTDLINRGLLSAFHDELRKGMAGGDVDVLASNLTSWAEDVSPVENSWDETIRTTAGDDPIETSQGGTLIKIKAIEDFKCTSLLATAENQLRLRSNGGGAVVISGGIYFPVPKLTYKAFGDAEENNGLIFVAPNGSNITSAIVRYKEIYHGVPTSINDGEECPSQTITYKGKSYKVYTTSGPGWLIVSNIDYNNACARIAWEDWYDKYVSPTDPNDVGGSVVLNNLFSAAPNGTGKFLVCGRVATYAERISDSQWMITDPVVRIASPSWTNTEIPATQDGGESTWLHELTISGMASGGSVLIGGSAQTLSVNGITVSYTDANSTPISGAVRYELATPATATVSLDSSYTLNDVGVEMKEGTVGTAEFVHEYSQNVADALSQIARYKVGEIQQDLEELKEDVDVDTAEMQAKIAALEAIVGGLNEAEGHVRVAGSSSPALSYKSFKYDETNGFARESVFSLFYPCLVGTKLTGDDEQVGKVLYQLQKLGATTVNGVPMWLDVDSVPHAIDGSEGDVLIVSVEDYYRIKGIYTIEGTDYDVYLASRMPFTWQGIEAEMVQKHGDSPDYCVSHADSDGVTRMHSVYNPSWNGSYSAPDAMVVGKYIYSDDGEGNITETYDANATLLGGAGGLHTTDLALYDGEQRAMNQNPDRTKTVPYMNQTAASVEEWFSLMLAEGGTFDAHNATLMGSGFCSNDAATSATDWNENASSAKNGLRVEDKNGEWKMYSLATDIKAWTGKSSAFYAGQLVNSWRNPWHIMEAHRAVSYAIQHGVGELEWFVFEGNKYKYRSVSGFAGPAQGEMTCVVWKMLSTKAGTNVVDPTDTTTSIAGNRIDILVSTALFHGITTQVSPSFWVSGLIFTQGADGQYDAYYEKDQAKLLISPTGDKLTSEQWDFENQYKHVGTFANGSGYRKNYSGDTLLLPDTDANKTGGGLHTYVGTYNYFNGTNPAAGKKSVRGFRRGAYAYNSYLSPLYVGANVAPSSANTSIGFGTCCRITEA